MNIAALFFALCAIGAHAEEPKQSARALYERAFVGDIDGMRSLWRPGITMPRVFYFSSMPRVNCYTVRLLQVGEPRIDGNHADVPVLAAWSRVDPVNQHETEEYEHAVIGMERSADGKWQIVKWGFEEEALVDQMLAAKSDDEAITIMLAHPELNDSELSRALRIRGMNLNFASDFDRARRLIDALHTFGVVNGDES